MLCGFLARKALHVLVVTLSYNLRIFARVMLLFCTKIVRLDGIFVAESVRFVILGNIICILCANDQLGWTDRPTHRLG